MNGPSGKQLTSYRSLQLFAISSVCFAILLASHKPVTHLPDVPVGERSDIENARVETPDEEDVLCFVKRYASDLKPCQKLLVLPQNRNVVLPGPVPTEKLPRRNKNITKQDGWRALAEKCPRNIYALSLSSLSLSLSLWGFAMWQ